MDALRLGELAARGGQHAVDRPSEVDGRRPRGTNPRRRRLERGAIASVQSRRERTASVAIASTTSPTVAARARTTERGSAR
jgi:hypothetical protein